MVFEHIEKLQAEYVDKYVVVDDQRPELRRFSGLTGVVKTVNMSGRALVQFDGRNNIGWYDIDIDYLRVVDQPLPKEEPQLARRAAASKKPPAPSLLRPRREFRRSMPRRLPHARNPPRPRRPRRVQQSRKSVMSRSTPHPPRCPARNRLRMPKLPPRRNPRSRTLAKE